MSVKKISKDQPDSFEFNLVNVDAAKKIISNYPDGKQQSAVTVSYTHLTLPTILRV